MLKRQTAETVFGQSLPEPRITLNGRALMALYLGAPLMIVLILFDLFLWAAIKTAFGVCFGLWCWV